MRKDTILILTRRECSNVETVQRHLSRMRQRVVRINTEELANIENSITLALSNGALNGRIRMSRSELDLERVKSVWYRRPEYPVANKQNNPLCRKFIEEEYKATLWSLYTTLPSFWMNPPLQSFHMIEHNKLHQAKIASVAGLDVPETIITNDADDLIAFAEKNNGYLALKTVRSRIFERGKKSFGIYTTKVSEKDLKEFRHAIELAPVMAQRYVDKKIELRVTIVGQHVLTCAIHSQSSERTLHDWRRYDFNKVKHERFQLPLTIKAKLLKFMKLCQLSFGAIDMIVTPDDKYVFLEINPSGQFGWIEKLTGLPISKAIAETLADSAANT